MTENTNNYKLFLQEDPDAFICSTFGINIHQSCALCHTNSSHWFGVVCMIKCSTYVFSPWYYCSQEPHKSVVSTLICVKISNPFQIHLKNVCFLRLGDKAIVRTDIKGRLLTPEEGCGFSNLANARIVGGSAAVEGAWPWMALFGRFYSEYFKVYIFSCGKLKKSKTRLSSHKTSFKLKFIPFCSK